MSNFVSGNVNNEEDMVKALEMIVNQYAGNSWLKRLQLEHTLLDKKIKKLDSFLEAQDKSTISDKMLGLMQHQLDAMQMYHTFILERLDLAHEEADCKVEEDIQDEENSQEASFEDIMNMISKEFQDVLKKIK